MRGCLTVLAVLFVLVFLGVELPYRLIGTGLDDFGDPGDRERRMAAKALFHAPSCTVAAFSRSGTTTARPSCSVGTPRA